MLGKALSALIAAVLKFFTENRSVIASGASGYAAAKASDRIQAADAEREAVATAEAREAELGRLDRPELLERMRVTDDRVRAIQARTAKRR